MKLSINQIIFLGFIFHLLAAVFSIGYHQCDELFQVFEFAGYKLHINDIKDLPWEFEAKMRSGLQPIIVFAITKIFYFFGLINPFVIATFIRVLQAIFSFYVTLKFIKLVEKQILTIELKKVFWFLGFLFWCVPYFHVRFSSENFSSTLFIYGLCFIIQYKEQINNAKLLLAGLLFGLAFISRFQILFFLIGLYPWLIFVGNISYKKLFFVTMGIIVALFLGLIVDYWMYNSVVCSWWNYLDQNLFQSKASVFGTSPFYYYFLESFIQLIPPFSLLIILALFTFWYYNSKSLITWITVPFLLLHILVPHKELRFLIPLINFLPFVICVFIQTLDKFPKFLSKIIFEKTFIRLAIFVNTILLCFFTFKPADDSTPILKAIFNQVKGKEPMLFFENTNPYNNQIGLNFFKNKQIETHKISDELIKDNKRQHYFFYEGYFANDILIKNERVFVRVYSNYPQWMHYFNFNGWLERSNSFSIYHQQ